MSKSKIALAATAVVVLTLAVVAALPAPDSRAGQGAPERTFVDVHHLGPGKVTAEAVAEAHAKDLAAQGKFGVSFERYWVDETSGTVVCLSRAPNAKAVNAAHAAAHGLVADEVLEVTEGH